MNPFFSDLLVQRNISALSIHIEADNARTPTESLLEESKNHCSKPQRKSARSQSIRSSTGTLDRLRRNSRWETVIKSTEAALVCPRRSSENFYLVRRQNEASSTGWTGRARSVFRVGSSGKISQPSNRKHVVPPRPTRRYSFSGASEPETLKQGSTRARTGSADIPYLSPGRLDGLHRLRKKVNHPFGTISPLQVSVFR